MAHKSIRKGREAASVAPDPIAIHHLPRQERPKRAYHQEEPQTNTDTNNKIQTKRQKRGTEGGSARSSSGDNGEDADISDTDATDADEEDNDDEDSDALAPSDYAIKRLGDQTGLTQNNGDHIGGLSRKTTITSPRSGAPNLVPSGTLKPIAETQSEECDSDDEYYKGVDLISDTEEGESDIEKSEEKDIIQSREDNISSVPATAFTSATDASDDWAGFDLDDDLLSTSMSHFDEQYDGGDLGILESELEIFRSASIYEHFIPLPSLARSPTPTPRRVRFKESVTPTYDDSDIISNDEDLQSLFNNATTMPFKDQSFASQEVTNEDDDESVGSSSGYETDYGDTTDEEDVPASATAKPERLMHQPSLSSVNFHSQGTSSTVSNSFKIPTTPATRRRGPRMGSWVADRTKPFAMIDCTGDNMVIVPAKHQATAISPLMPWDTGMASTANRYSRLSQPTWAMDDSEVDLTDFSAFATDPMLASEPDVLPSTLLPTAPSSQVHDQTLASTSVFMPMDSVGDFGSMFPADDQHMDEDDDEDLLKVEDFIDFGVSSDDEADEERELAMTTSLPTPASTSPGARRQSQITTSPTYDLLKHLDKGLVGSFRRSQPFNQAHLRRPQSGLSLSSHAFKGGRVAAGDNSLSAQKKRKLSDALSSRPVFGKRRSSNRR